MTPITEQFLRSSGFHWHELERSTDKHWILWLGNVLPDTEDHHRLFSNEDLGITLTPGDQERTWWYCWLRADYAGRYSRCICMGHYSTQEQVTTLISAIAQQPFIPGNVMYGSLRHPAVADRLRKEDKSLHQRIARDWAQAASRDDGKPFDPDQNQKNGVTH